MDASTSANDTNAERELRTTRFFDAPRSLVFKAWTQPEHVARWWGPQGFTTIFCQMDIRAGGAFRCGMRSPQGTEHWKTGVYREIVPPERIVFTFAWEDEAGRPGHEVMTTVTFAEEGTGTRLTLYQAVFKTTERRDDHRQGWTSTLQRLAGYLATIGIGEVHAASSRLPRAVDQPTQSSAAKGETTHPPAR